MRKPKKTWSPTREMEKEPDVAKEKHVSICFWNSTPGHLSGGLCGTLEVPMLRLSTPCVWELGYN